MKISSFLIMLVTATNIVWGANLAARADAGASLRRRWRRCRRSRRWQTTQTLQTQQTLQTLEQLAARAGAGKRAAGPGTCPTNGFSPPGFFNCVCNFAGACDLSTGAKTTAAKNDTTNLNGIAPQNMDNFAFGTPSVGTVCEGGTVAILYDCNARIPLYAATVIEGANAGGKFKRKNCWRKTTDLQLSGHKNLLAEDEDYRNSNNRVYCYEDSASGNLLEWDGQPCKTPKKFSIHRGHMIAAQYGQGHGQQAGVDATFTYTNAVPQIGSFNSGKWRVAETSVITRAKKCQQDAANNGHDAKVYVVVGVIPSSFVGEPRFFGSAGFSNFQGMSKINPLKGYRVSFPEIMWTAGCCVHTDGTIAERFAFWRRNWLTKDVVKQFSSASVMFADIKTEITKAWPSVTFNAPTIFPKETNCE